MNLFGTTTKKIKTYGKKSGERVVTINAWNYEIDEKKEPINLSGSIPTENTERKDKIRKRNSLRKSAAPKLQTSEDVTSENSENISPKWKENVPSRVESINRIRVPLTSKNVSVSHEDTQTSFSDIKHLEIDKLVKEHEITDELTELLNICDKKQLWTFEEFLGTDCLDSATKIGEASFSEVFAAYAPNFTSARVKCVFKIIPFGRGKEVLVNGEEQCSVRDITQEIKSTLELGGRTGLDPKLRVGFLKLYGVGVCRGKYPEILLKEWDRWDEKYKSESDRPDYFDDKQLYAVLIVEYGGLDLEHVKLKNWAQAWSVLTQVGWSTAQAEQSLKFEHRDLHWGNITIKPTKIKSISYNLLLNNINVEVETFGVRACVIDYTLSRMERGDEIVYVNIVDEGYFIGKNDYQFDIYRMMRKESNGDWKSFWPRTNVFWLHYVADKLLTAKKLSRPKKDSDQYVYYDAILGFKKRALAKSGGYKSAMEAMNQDVAWRI